ncbi:hypothetical protein BC831DRAFT_510596 [Entophlyctis helioformis]|nr:hypothetical protein BC831DRAFT_510596 [Entophlyctis helioformis]
MSRRRTATDSVPPSRRIPQWEEWALRNSTVAAAPQAGASPTTESNANPPPAVPAAAPVASPFAAMPVRRRLSMQTGNAPPPKQQAMPLLPLDILREAEGRPSMVARRAIASRSSVVGKSFASASLQGDSDSNAGSLARQDQTSKPKGTKAAAAAHKPLVPSTGPSAASSLNGKHAPGPAAAGSTARKQPPPKSAAASDSVRAWSAGHPNTSLNKAKSGRVGVGLDSSNLDDDNDSDSDDGFGSESGSNGVHVRIRSSRVRNSGGAAAAILGVLAKSFGNSATRSAKGRKDKKGSKRGKSAGAGNTSDSDTDRANASAMDGTGSAVAGSSFRPYSADGYDEELDDPLLFDEDDELDGLGLIGSAGFSGAAAKDKASSDPSHQETQGLPQQPTSPSDVLGIWDLSSRPDTGDDPAALVDDDGMPRRLDDGSDQALQANADGAVRQHSGDPNRTDALNQLEDALADLPSDRRGGSACPPRSPKAANPLSALTGSQLNLLSSTTGNFRGPGDVYARFLMGGRNIRISARRALAAALHATETGAMDEFLVDKNASRINAVAKNPRAIERLRKKHKELLKHQMVHKVETLEETRVYIITHMSSLTSYHRTMMALKEENAKLKAEHEQVVADINKRVSETLAKNEESDHMIKRLQREKASQRRKLTKEYSAFLQKSAADIKALECKLEECRKTYESQVQELIDLKEFKAMTFMDPEVIAKRVSAEQERAQQQMTEQDRLRKQYDDKFVVEEQEAEQMVVDRIMEIIEEAKAQLSSFINKSTTTAYKENKRLKNEIQMQSRHQEILAEEIKVVEGIRKGLMSERDKHVDERRRVLNLKACMTCTPDMDVAVPSSRTYLPGSDDGDSHTSYRRQFTPSTLTT